MYIKSIYTDSFLFFFNDTATTEIYTLSLHDALPISGRQGQPRQAHLRLGGQRQHGASCGRVLRLHGRRAHDPCALQGQRSEEHTSELSHLVISYAVFCLKKKKK